MCFIENSKVFGDLFLKEEFSMRYLRLTILMTGLFLPSFAFSSSENSYDVVQRDTRQSLIQEEVPKKLKKYVEEKKHIKALIFIKKSLQKCHAKDLNHNLPLQKGLMMTLWNILENNRRDLHRAYRSGFLKLLLPLHKSQDPEIVKKTILIIEDFTTYET